MERSGLEVIDVENLRRHYALTLDAWAERFDANWKAIHALDPARFDEYFRRKWRTYLWSCAEMFRSPNGSTHLFQVTVSKGNVGAPLSDEPGPSLSLLSMTPYEAKKARLLDELAAARAQGGATVGLAKQTSNLFRDRAARKRPARRSVALQCGAGRRPGRNGRRRGHDDVRRPGRCDAGAGTMPASCRS